tara:strand:- start:328 stop:435 length:108 start_codon:yes stop_codon:yes gene_type:complete
LINKTIDTNLEPGTAIGTDKPALNILPLKDLDTPM